MKRPRGEKVPMSFGEGKESVFARLVIGAE